MIAALSLHVSVFRTRRFSILLAVSQLCFGSRMTERDRRRELLPVFHDPHDFSLLDRIA